MNRSNVGNVVTNGMQILSVSGTNIAGFKRMLNKQDDANLNKIRLSQKENADQTLSQSPFTSYGQSGNAQNVNKLNEPIDEFDATFADIDSPQIANISDKIRRSIYYLSKKDYTVNDDTVDFTKLTGNSNKED